MKRVKYLIVIYMLCPFASFAQGTIRTAFDGPPLQPPGSAILVQQYSESGMHFRPLSGSVGFGRVWTNPASFRPDNGTPYLQAGLGSDLVFNYQNAPTFGLVSIDLAEYSTVVPDAVTVPFIGYRSDGSTVSASFTTDGVIDGTGPVADFQTFYFGPEFIGLTRVEIPNYGWSLDNLVVSIPEPAATGLLGMGAVIALFWKTRKKSA